MIKIQASKMYGVALPPTKKQAAFDAFVRRAFGAWARGVIAVLGGAVLACDPVNKVSPEIAAKAWLEATKTPYEGTPACTGGDTDGDGYVTCLVRQPRTDQTAPPFFSLQCAAIGAGEIGGSPYTSGCKPTQWTKQ